MPLLQVGLNAFFPYWLFTLFIFWLSPTLVTIYHYLTDEIHKNEPASDIDSGGLIITEGGHEFPPDRGSPENTEFHHQRHVNPP